MTTPTQTELTSLPAGAAVLLAARGLKRLLPLAAKLWKSAPAEHMAVLADVVAAAEAGTPPTPAEVARLTAAVVAAREDLNRANLGQPDGHVWMVYAGAEKLLDALAYPDPSCVDAEAAVRLPVGAAYPDKRAALIAAIRADFDALRSGADRS